MIEFSYEILILVLVFDAQRPAEVMENEDSCMQTSADQGAALEEKPEVWDIPKQS